MAYLSHHQLHHRRNPVAPKSVLRYHDPYTGADFVDQWVHWEVEEMRREDQLAELRERESAINHEIMKLGNTYQHQMLPLFHDHGMLAHHGPGP